MKDKRDSVLRIVRISLLVFAFIVMLWCIFDESYTKYGGFLSGFILPFVPLFVSRAFRIKIPFRIELLYYTFVFIALDLGICFDFYVYVPFYDKIVHFLSGVATALIGHYAVEYFNAQRSPRLFRALFIIFFSMAIAVSWEFFEFACDKLLDTKMQQLISVGIDDTMYDLLSATGGAIVGGWIMSRKGVSRYLKEK